MMQPRKLALVFCLFFAAGLALEQGCAKTPPTLSPAAAVAFQNLQVQKSIDTIRDVAIAANATEPPLISTPSTRTIVTWHQSALVVLKARETGWVSIVSTSLDEALKHLKPEERSTIGPYVTLAKTILHEATK
jgi:hypothetical protein